MELIKNYGGSSTEYSNSPPKMLNIDSKTALIGIDWRKYTSEIFVSKEDSDFVVIVSDKEKGEQEIKLHSYVLRSRIPDFANVLKHDSKERDERIVRITDFSFDVMNSFFEFAYCGTATNIEELAPELLKVADKYNFAQLKLICSEKIGKNLNVENAASVCSIAFFAQAEDLLNEAKNFIIKPDNFHLCRYEMPDGKIKRDRQSWKSLPHEVLSDILESQCKKRKVDSGPQDIH